MVPKWGRLLGILTLGEKYGKPPSTWLGGEAWGVKDQILTLAHHIYRTELVCGCCGTPTRYAHGPKTAGGWWKVEQQICNVAEARDHHQQENNEHPTPGALILPVLEAGHNA